MSCPLQKQGEMLCVCRHSDIKANAMLATVYAFEVRYGLPVVFVPTGKAGARLMERWAFYFARETVAVVNDLWRAESR